MRVTRTFVFVDISGFTKFTAATTDEVLTDLLKRWREATRDIAEEFGVRIEKWLGDGCLVIAVEQESGIRFALSLQARGSDACAPLSMRIGIVTGLALQFQGEDYIGEAVNLASRLCDAADPGQVLMPDGDAIELPAGVTASSVPPLTLRGFDAPVSVVNLTGDAEAGPSDTGELWTREGFPV
ncbi:MAG: adenylate/guanylate cyclase domain-containing protein [Acidimicrobiales bacterium]